MTRRSLPCVCRWLVVSALAVFCLWRSIDAASAYLGSSDAYDYLANWRSAARNAPEGNLALLTGDSDRLSPVERTRLVAMSWERAPDPILQVDASNDLRFADCVLSSNWLQKSATEKFESEGFEAVSTNAYVRTWMRKDAARPAPCPRAESVSRTREVVSLLLELMLMFLMWTLLSRSLKIGGWSLIVAFSIAVCLGCVALSHPLLAPNGLGVYGAKAKLLYECGGIPEPFLRSAGGMVLQPSYPPGLTFLAWSHFALSGGCSDRLVQLLVVFAMAFLSVELMRNSSCVWAALPVALFCLSPVGVKLTSGFYAEPFSALALVAGWNMMRRKRFCAGAVVMGLAGLFRPEAGIVAGVFAASAFNGRWHGKAYTALVSATPSVLWFVACRALGLGFLSDWNIVSAPNFGNVAYAAAVEMKTIGLLVLPIAMVAVIVGRSRRPERGGAIVRAMMPMAVLFLAIPLSFCFYDSPQAAWMAENTIPRTVWSIFAIPLCALQSEAEAP